MVDDREIEGRRATRLLRCLGCRCNLAAGATTDQTVRSELPDLLFVSTHSVALARSVTARIRSREREDSARGFEPRHVPIIGFGESECTPTWCLDAGMDDFLIGPLLADSAAHALRTWTPHTLALVG